jgi:hypothetical protein
MYILVYFSKELHNTELYKFASKICLVIKEGKTFITFPIMFCADIHKNMYCISISVCMEVKSVGYTGFYSFTVVQSRCSCLWRMVPYHLVIGARYVKAV